MVERELDGRRARRNRVAPDADESVVGVDDGHAAGGQRARQRRVLDGHVGDRPHELLVFALRVVDDRDRGLGDVRQRRRLAGVIHSQLDHRGAVLRAQSQHGERQPDRIVEVALRRVHRVVAERRAQYRGQHLLDRRLAVAADDDRHRERELPPPVRGEPGQRRQRVGDDDEIARDRVRARFGDQRRRRAALEGRGDEVVAVEAFARERDEEIAALQHAGVGRHARERHARADQAGAEDARCGGGVHHGRSIAASAASTSRASENGVRTPPASW